MNPVTELLADIGILKVHVTNTQDLMPKQKKDCVISVKTFQSAFPESGFAAAPSTAVGFQPEHVLPHTSKRVYASIRNLGTPFVAAVTQPAPSNPAVPATGVAQQNVNAFPVQVVISANGATITNVSVNGNTVGTAAGTYTVPAYGSISIAYSVATPTWVWTNANANIPASGNANVYLCSSIADAMQTTPVGFVVRPGDDLVIHHGTTELYLVANGSGAAPLVSVLSVIEQ